MPTVSCWEVEKAFDVCIFDCDFTQGVENDSYVTLDLTQDRVDELKEELEWQEGKGDGDMRYARGIRAELKIIEGFREMGYDTSILVFITW
jgi:hypothetical protein